MALPGPTASASSARGGTGDAGALVAGALTEGEAVGAGGATSVAPEAAVEPVPPVAAAIADGVGAAPGGGLGSQPAAATRATRPSSALRFALRIRLAWRTRPP